MGANGADVAGVTRTSLDVKEKDWTYASGPTWCFLHPIGTSSRIWAPTLERLGLEYSTLALDLPGHGQTPASSDVFRLETAAEWVLQQLNATHRDVILVGHSIGGMIAQILAAWNPVCLKGLVLVSTMSRPPSEVARQGILGRAQVARDVGMKGLIEPTMIRWFTESSMKNDPHTVSFVSDLLQSADPEVHAQAWEAIAGLNTTELLPQIRIPMLVMVGDEDVSTPPSLSEEIVRLCPTAKLQIIAGAGHALPQERPDAFVDGLKGFAKDAGL